MKKNLYCWKKSLWIYEDELKEVGFIDWLKAHTSFFKPLHRYEGVIKLNDKNIILDGKNVKTSERCFEKIKLEDIVDIYHGFDEVFRRRDERSPWNKPVRIRYVSDDREKTVYIYADFYYRLLIRSSKNKDFYRMLKEIFINLEEK